MKHLFLTLAILCTAGFATAKPLVYVPVLPYEFLFEKIGGDLIEVRAIVGEGDDCHDYSPTPKQIVQISKSNMLFSGDLGFEGNFYVKIGDGKNAPKAVDLLDGLNLLEGSCAACIEAKKRGDLEAAAKHNHDDLKDPHVWLSPKILLQQSQKAAESLKSFLNDEKASATIDQNLAAFSAELKTLDEDLRKALTPLKGEKFYVYHGAFAYFALDYGLEQVAIEIGNRRPTPKQLTSIVRQAKKDDVKIVFVQPQFDQTSAKSLAKAIGGQVETLDPLEKDVVANLRKIAAAMSKIQK